MTQKLKEKINRKPLTTVAEAADELQIPCYVVGGYVRDLILQRPSKDIDFVCVGPESGITTAKEVAKRIGRSARTSIFRTYGTAQVASRGMELEFVAARKESYQHSSRNPIVESGTLDDDLSRRDFTINAMAISLNADNFGELIDRFGGMQDIARGIIRTPLDPDITFSDDPLRMLRAIRFATQLNFTIFPETLQAITRNASRIKIITTERISTELNKIMLSDAPSIGWRLLAQTGLLAHILPELNAMQGVEVIHGRGHKDNFDHTMLVLDRVAGASPNLWLRWGALLHDIAKPVTKRWVDGTGWTFHNHNFVGAKMVKNIFRKLKLPLGEPLRYVQKMVELHMRPIALVEDTVTDSAIRRLITDAGDDLNDLMTLCRADITSRNPEKVRTHLKNFDSVMAKIEDVDARDNLRKFQPPVDGDEIMATFNLPPSKPVGEIKAAIKEAILEGIIPNEHDAAYAFMLEKGAEMGLYKA
ncbi:MAG: CCA tRNA nucleotidyltransferase [Firmicutes bacterium]|nr:CCA tRNA nucleotidyltransferase [Bacillota bacterium]MCM1400541.1 CCA tRNA nucleotidyltransferase [Bacteroides sp.]MCM1476445.1 CCA tRNA nucleotidyltransferase [Bacteroides sp.]